MPKNRTVLAAVRHIMSSDYCIKCFTLVEKHVIMGVILIETSSIGGSTLNPYAAKIIRGETKMLDVS